MISPDPTPEPELVARDERRAPVRTVAAGARDAAAGGGLGGIAAAALVGVAFASFVLAAAAAQRAVLPFGRHGALGWWGCAAAAAAAWSLARSARTARGGAFASALAAVVVAGASAAAAYASSAAAAWPLAAAALGAASARAFAAGRAAWRSVAGVVAAAGAALLLARAPMVLAGDVALAAVLAATLASVVASGTVSGDGTFASATVRFAGSGRRLVRLALGAGVAFALSTMLANGAAASALAPGAAPAAVAAGAVALAARALPAAVLAAACALALPLLPGGGAVPAADARVVETHGSAQVRYARDTHELQLVVDGAVADAAGPERTDAPLAVALVHAFARAGDRVLVLGAGTGRVVADLEALQRHVLDVVDWRPDVAPLRALLLADGPLAVAQRTAPRWPVRHAGLAASLAALVDGARQAIVLGEPLAAATPATSVEVQHELRRVAGNGPVLQLVALDRTPPDALHALFAAAVETHPWNGLFLVGDGAVLVSAPAAPTMPVEPFAAWSDDARWQSHGAHLGDGDIGRALVGTLPKAAPAAHDGAAPRSRPATAAGHRAAVLDVVRAWLVPAAEVEATAGGSVLAHWTASQARQRDSVARIRACADDANGRATAAALAARFLHVGAPRAELQAALGLPLADGVTLADPALAARRAHALAPGLFDAPPPVCASLPLPTLRTGPLEDVASLPPRPRLAQLASGSDPFAVALRARFPSRCARALVEALARGPLDADAGQVLRELADPFVLAEAGAVLARQGRCRELLALWRADLPVPAALDALARGDTADRRMLAAALRSRREPSCVPLVAALLDDDALEVRALAAEALAELLPARVAYDPHGSRAAHREAARQVRALHNRQP